jgi:hypothetical protein
MSSTARRAPSVADGADGDGLTATKLTTGTDPGAPGATFAHLAMNVGEFEKELAKPDFQTRVRVPPPRPSPTPTKKHSPHSKPSGTGPWQSHSTAAWI